MKRLFDESWTGSTEETLRLEADIQLGLLGTPNQLAAVTAGMTKQPAEFADPNSAVSQRGITTGERGTRTPTSTSRASRAAITPFPSAVRGC